LRPGRFIPGLRAPDTHWVSLSPSGLGGKEKNPIFDPAGD